MSENSKNNSPVQTRESRRIKMTKRLIKDALIELLQQKKAFEVTVHELCTLADVNRSTFYAHYGTLSDVFADIGQDFISQTPFTSFNDEISEHQKQNAMIRYLRYIQDNQRAFIVLFETGYLNQFIMEKALAISGDSLFFGVDMPEIKKLIIWQSTAGCSYAIYYWLNHGGFTIEEMAVYLLAMLPTPVEVYQAVHRLRQVEKS